MVRQRQGYKMVLYKEKQSRAKAKGFLKHCVSASVALSDRNELIFEILWLDQIKVRGRVMDLDKLMFNDCFPAVKETVFIFSTRWG